MRFLKVFGLVLLFLISMMFFIQNTEILSQEMSLQLNFYIGDYVAMSRPLPFYFLLLVAFALGAILVLFYFLLEKIRLSGQLKECRRERDKLEQEVNSLRNLPLESDTYASSSTGSSYESSESASVESKEDEDSQK